MKKMISKTLLLVLLADIVDSYNFVNESSDLFTNVTENSLLENLSNSSVASTLPPLLQLGPFDRYIEQMPVFGYPGPLFYALHSLALISLSTSVLVSVVLILYLCFWSPTNSSEAKGQRTVRTSVTTGGTNSSKFHPQTSTGSTKKWNITDRLVIYLAVIDLGMGVSHMLDHAYMVYTKSNPPDAICSAFAFILQTFSFSQWVIVAYTAVNACSMIVFSKKLQLGRLDWKLILCAFFCPLVVGMVTLRLGFLGQSGAWCFTDLRTQAGLRYAEALSVLQIVDFGVIGISYGAILCKIRQSAKKLADEKADRYRNSARIMIIFVVVFIFQWWSTALFSLWSFSENPPSAIYVMVATFTNLGGVYNSIAYTLIRRRFTRVASNN